MLFINEYKLRPGMPREDTARLMAVFGERGAEDGTIAHYVKADGSGGIVIIDQDDMVKAYEATLAYDEFLEFNATPALTIEEAVGPIAGYIGG